MPRTPEAKPGRAKPQKAAGPESVEAFLATLDPTARVLVDELRAAILAADPSIEEGIKWNVPSFRTAEYFATLNLRVREGIGLILHFGAKKNSIATTGVEIVDPDSLLQWLGKDRAAVAFRDAAELAARRPALTRLIRAWIRHV